MHPCEGTTLLISAAKPYKVQDSEVKMRKLFVLIATIVGIGSFAAAGSIASVDFVCPVFNSEAVGAHNPNAVQIGGGDYTIIPSGAQYLDVPDHATNGDGAGTSPGDKNYSAIWNS